MAGSPSTSCSFTTVYVVVPSLMVFGALSLRPRVAREHRARHHLCADHHRRRDRRVNYYILGSAIEVALLMALVYYAWFGRKQPTIRPSPHSSCSRPATLPETLRLPKTAPQTGRNSEREDRCVSSCARTSRWFRRSATGQVRRRDQAVRVHAGRALGRPRSRRRCRARSRQRRALGLWKRVVASNTARPAPWVGRLLERTVGDFGDDPFELPDERVDVGSDDVSSIRGQLDVGGEELGLVEGLALLAADEEVEPASQALRWRALRSRHLRAAPRSPPASVR